LLAVAGLLTLPPAAPAQDTPAAPPPTTAGLDNFGSTNAIVIAKPRRNQISVSGDFSLEQGKISIPIGYSLNAALAANGFSKTTEFVASAKRSSDYYGGTVSYSHGQAWFFDISYAQGKSTGTQDIPFGSYGSGTGNFTLDDDWYQAYVRYAFPKLRGKKLSAYVRAGGTYVDSNLTFDGITSYEGLYHQSDKTTDYYGNLGLGATYAFYTRGRFSAGLQGELEAFGGQRTQKSLESLPADPGLTPVPDNIDNTVYGGIGRGTLHLEYRVGSSGLCRLFMDAGAQYQYSEISYPSGGDKSETLFGPYVKLGLRYSF
jgi:hypothetical protein